MRTEPIDRSPARVSGRLGVGAGVIALAVAGAYASTAAVVAAGGLVGLVGGVLVGRRRLVSVGAAALLSGVLLSGTAGAPALPLLVGVGATVLAWDLGGTAIDVGAQLGREADTVRLEVVHAVASAAVATAAAGVGYGVYLTAVGGQPMAALLLLLLAGVLLLATLDYS